MSVSDEDIRILFDCAVWSLDAGSGHLDNEESDAFRRVAAHLGVDVPSGILPPVPRPPSPRQVAASRGHIGVAYKMVDEKARIEQYTCRCGWKGRFAAFDDHLIANST